MAQHDYVIANGTGAAVRSDLNNALAAIVSQNSGATEPATTYAYQWWADTTTNLLKLRNSANSGWITLFQLDGEYSTIALENGTAAAPSIYFKDSGTDTGFYSPGANQVGISTGGTARLTIDSNGNVDIDSNTLYVDATNNRVGLGTSSPGALLHVNQATAGSNVLRLTGNYSASGTSPLIVFERDGGAVAGHLRYNDAFNAMQIGTTSAHRFDLYTNSSTALTIDSSQRVGIGTTSPGKRLEVRPGSSGDGVLIANGGYQTFGSNATLYLSGGVNNNGDFAGFAIASEQTSAAQHVLKFCRATANADNSNFAVSTEYARIDASGRLLVGTSSAFDSVALGTDFSLGIERANYVGIALKSNIANAVPSYLAFNKSRGTTLNSKTIVANNDELGAIVFGGADGTNMVTAAAIVANVDGTPGTNDMPGRLVFSTTADGASSPTERMRISSTGGANSFVGATNFNVRTSSTSASDGTFIVWNGATGVGDGTARFVVRADGDCENTNNSYGALSDRKLKENIVDANSQWDDLKALQVRNYNFKEGQTHKQIGLIAQEVELVSPGLVSESPDRDEDGNDLGTTTKSVNYSVLYMKAVKALQEAMERIESLEAKVAALEAS